MKEVTNEQRRKEKTMNGAECIWCGDCTHDSSDCPKHESKESRESKVAKRLETFEADTNALYQVLMKPKGIRQRLLKWLYPELRNVANSLRECYWSR